MGNTEVKIPRTGSGVELSSDRYMDGKDENEIFYDVPEESLDTTTATKLPTQNRSVIRYHRVSSPIVSQTTIGQSAQDMTAGEIREEVAKHMGLPDEYIDIVSLAQGSMYDDDDFINIKQTLDIVQHPEDRTVPVTMRTTLPDITYSDIDEPRIQMNCGHAITPDNLYMNAAVKLNDGDHEVKCFVCNCIWDFDEIAEKSQMTIDEKLFWGTRVTINMIRKNESITECPKCQIYCERIDPSSNGVLCTACTTKGNLFYFCWKCKHMEWNTRHNCDTKEGLQQILNTCSKKTMGYSNVPNVPSCRLCPKCGMLIEHIEACKETLCHRCKKSFCFICLTICTDSMLQCTEFDQVCNVAPVQTA